MTRSVLTVIFPLFSSHQKGNQRLIALFFMITEVIDETEHSHGV